MFVSSATAAPSLLRALAQSAGVPALVTGLLKSPGSGVRLAVDYQDAPQDQWRAKFKQEAAVLGTAIASTAIMGLAAIPAAKRMGVGKVGILALQVLTGFAGNLVAEVASRKVFHLANPWQLVKSLQEQGSALKAQLGEALSGNDSREAALVASLPKVPEAQAVAALAFGRQTLFTPPQPLQQRPVFQPFQPAQPLSYHSTSGIHYTA